MADNRRSMAYLRVQHQRGVDVPVARVREASERVEGGRADPAVLRRVRRVGKDPLAPTRLRVERRPVGGAVALVRTEVVLVDLVARVGHLPIG